MMTAMDAVALLIRRMEASPDRRAKITGLEYRQWSDAVCAMLEAEPLLVPAEPAEEARCPGCDLRCFMEVERLPAVPGRGAQTFIICDRDDGPGGTIDIDPPELLRWQSHAERFAVLLARVLGAMRALKPSGQDRWSLGPIRVGKDRQDYYSTR
jgi:hypothetical protein